MNSLYIFLAAIVGAIAMLFTRKKKTIVPPPTTTDIVKQKEAVHTEINKIKEDIKVTDTKIDNLEKSKSNVTVPETSLDEKIKKIKKYTKKD